MDLELRDIASKAVAEYTARMENLEMHTALLGAWSLISGLNKYIDRTAPWELAKNNKPRLSVVIYHIMEALRYVSVLISPVMPDTSREILEVLSIDGGVSIEDLKSFGAIKPGVKIKEPRALFPRVEKERERKEKVPAAKEKEKDNLVDMSEFARIEIRAGRIMEASAVEKSDKLLLLKVDVGRPIQIVAGIGKAYKPEDLPGKYIAVVTNLKPAKLMGLASEGMLLATDSDGGKLTLLSFSEAPKVGARIR